MKSRNVKPLEFLEALQKEYICAVVRSKIYPRINDKRYYKKVASGKEEKIIDISSRNELPNIFESKKEYDKYWKGIINKFGFPNFIYNQNYNDTKKDFPYKGTIVEITEEGAEFQYGVTSRVDFEDKLVFVSEKEGDEPVPFYYKNVRRLTLEETDKMFYYYPGNDFKFIGIDGEISSGTLTNFDYEKDLAFIDSENKGVSYPHKPSKIARIL